MNAVSLKFYIDALRINAEIEGMKALNAMRAHRNETPAYTEEQFQAKAEELASLGVCLHEAWQAGAAQ